MTTALEAQQNYVKNADYEATSSLVKCRAFITACIQLLAFPEQSAKRGSGLTGEQRFNHEQIRNELEYARQWLIDNEVSEHGAKGTDYTVHPDFTDFDSRT